MIRPLTSVTRRFALLAVVIAALAALASGPVEADGFARGALTIETSDGARHPFEIEIARTDREQGLGLMYRRVVPDGYGMLFDFGEVREANFWMRNTYVSLDILFVNADGTIHRIAKATQPLSDRLIPSRGPVRAVFEVVAGTTDRLGIRVGDVLIHEIFANTGR